MADEDALQPQPGDDVIDNDDTIDGDQAEGVLDGAEGVLDGAEEGEGPAGEPSIQEKLKEVVDVQVEDVGTLRKKLKITLPAEAIQEQLDEQYGELSREAQVPGFRKGRAPRRLLEKRFGNEVGENLTQQLVSGGYIAATEKLELKVIGEPLISATPKDADSPQLMDIQKAIEVMDLPEEGPLVFTCEVEVQPEFELPKLDKIPVKKPVIEISDEDITRELDRFRQMSGTHETIDEPAAADDVLNADVKMTCDGQTVKEEQGARVAVRAQVVDGVTLDKLGEVLTGAKVGDTVTISAEVPDTHEKEELRGKQAEFAITVQNVTRLRVPELDEEFVKRLGFESEQELRDYFRSDMESRIGEQVKSAMAGQVYEYLLKNCTFELPERLSDRQTAQVVTRRMIELYQQGTPPAEVEKQMDELKTSAKEDAMNQMKVAFIMEKLADQFEVDVNEGEINTQIAMMAQRRGQRFDRVRDELIKQNALTDLYVQIRDQKLVDQLLADADITETDPKAEAKDQGAGSEASVGDSADET